MSVSINARFFTGKAGVTVRGTSADSGSVLFNGEFTIPGELTAAGDGCIPGELTCGDTTPILGETTPIPGETTPIPGECSDWPGLECIEGECIEGEWIDGECTLGDVWGRSTIGEWGDICGCVAGEF